MRRRAFLLPAATAFLVTGCLSGPAPVEQPARIVDPTDASRAELERIVSEALYVERVTLADDALTDTSVLVVGRSRIAGRELGTPERFRLVKERDRCVLVHEGSGRRFDLPAADCVPVGNSP